MRNTTQRWESHYLKDSTYGNVGFKTLRNSGYPLFSIAEIVIDQVDLQKFLKPETERIPLIIGTQFGFFPRLNQIPGLFLEPRVIALLSKSVLSGSVAGLTICLIPDGAKPWKVIKDFPEKPELFQTSNQSEINPGKDFGIGLNSGERLVIK